MTNYQMLNGQKELYRRRPHDNTRPIAAIRPEMNKQLVPESDGEKPINRMFQVTPLADFRYDHLRTPEQRGRLERAVSLAQRWIANRDQRSLSFVVTGPVGTGKTTIAMNLIQPFRYSSAVGVDEDIADIIDLYERALGKMQKGDPLRVKVETQLAELTKPVEAVEGYGGRLYEATELMRLIADQTPLGVSLGSLDVIVVDDAGTEDFSTGTYIPSEDATRPIRHNRYGRFFDYCYRKGKRVVVTSMVPVHVYPEGRPSPNPDFINIFGSKAWTRLNGMAYGYMADLTGLPDIRPLLAKGMAVS